MARSTQYRTFINAACAAAALALGCPLAVIAGNTATTRAAHPGLAPSQTRMVAAAAPVSGSATPSASQSQSMDDLLAALPDPSSLTAASAQQSQSAQKVIVAQLDAFRGGNFEQADTYQAKSLRATFSSTQQFRVAMSEAYPEFTAYKSVLFGMTTADKTGRYVVVPVTLTGQDGVTVQALYIMLHPAAATIAVSKTPAAADYQVLTVLGGMNPHPIIEATPDYQTA